MQAELIRAFFNLACPVGTRQERFADYHLLLSTTGSGFVPHRRHFIARTIRRADASSPLMLAPRSRPPVPNRISTADLG